MTVTVTVTPARALANLMAGFGRLGFYPGDGLAACVRARLLAALPSLNARDVSDVVGAWADLAHRCVWRGGGKGGGGGLSVYIYMFVYIHVSTLCVA